MIGENEDRFKYNKIRISKLIQNDKTDKYKNVSIYRFSSKQLSMQHNLFNIYLECNLLNKAYKLVMIDFDFSFSLTAEIIFLYKIYLIELKKKNILNAFDLLSMTFHKCFVLLKKYLCNTTSFKLLSLICINFSSLIFNYPFLRKYLYFSPNEKIKFIMNNIIRPQNITENSYYNDYFRQTYEDDALKILYNNQRDTQRQHSILHTYPKASIRSAIVGDESSSYCDTNVGKARNSREEKNDEKEKKWRDEKNYEDEKNERDEKNYEDKKNGRDEKNYEKEKKCRDEKNYEEETFLSNEFNFYANSHFPLSVNSPVRERKFSLRANQEDIEGKKRNTYEKQYEEEGGNMDRYLDSPSNRGFLYDEQIFCLNRSMNIYNNMVRVDGLTREEDMHRNGSLRNNSKVNHKRYNNWINDSSYFGEKEEHEYMFDRYENFHINKIIQSFNFIFNILEKAVTSCEVSLMNYNNRGALSIDRPPMYRRHILTYNNYKESVCNITNFIKEMVNKLDLYFRRKFFKKKEKRGIKESIRKHIKDLDDEKCRNFLHDSSVIRSLKKSHEESFFSCLEFLFLSYVCSNYFSDNVSKNYKYFLKTFNFNNIWLSNEQIKVKILLGLIHLLLYEINLIDLNEFFLQILKIILHKFYNYLDYNDLQIFQYIYMNISNDTLFSSFSLCDDINNVIKINFAKFPEFFYIFHMSKMKKAFSHHHKDSRRWKFCQDIFIADFLSFICELFGGKQVGRKKIGGSPTLDLTNEGVTSDGCPFVGLPNEGVTNEGCPVGDLPNEGWLIEDEATGKDLIGRGFNETILWDDPFIEDVNSKDEWIPNETLNDGLVVDRGAWDDELEVQKWKCEDEERETSIHEVMDKEYESFLDHELDCFKSEKCFEKNDFVFFKRNKKKIKGKEALGCGSDFFDKILSQIGKKNKKEKNVNRKKTPLRIVRTCEVRVEEYDDLQLEDRKKTATTNFPIDENTKFKEKDNSDYLEQNIEDRYERILNNFKIRKETYIEKYMNKKNESFIRLQTFRDRYHYYQNMKPNNYEAYNFEKCYYLSEEICETNCFILAEHKNKMGDNFTLEKNSYIYICLNLLSMIDLYMEYKVNIYNKPLYFVKHLIITCANISYSKNLSVLYIHTLIRLCLFEMRMHNVLISANILLEILNNFEKIKNYKNILGIIFYLCGYLLIHQLNFESERMRDEKRKEGLIQEYNYYANLKKNYICTFQKNKLDERKFVKNYTMSDISFVKTSVLRSQARENVYSGISESTDGEDQIGLDIYTVPLQSSQVEDNGFFTKKCIDSDGYINPEGVSSGSHANWDHTMRMRTPCSKNNYIMPFLREKEKLNSDMCEYTGKKKKNICKKNNNLSKLGTTKCVKKLIPLVKNQIKITNYFCNVKNEKLQDVSSDENSAILDNSTNVNNSSKNYVKKRKKNDGLTDHVVIEKGNFPSDPNFEEMKNHPYDLFEQINKKQFCLLLICFYMKQSLQYWKCSGDVVGIFNGIQQKKRVKDAFFFLMSSYKFFYKSSLFLSKQSCIQNYKYPFFNYELFREYHKFYIFYRRAFRRCCNENVVNVFWECGHDQHGF